LELGRWFIGVEVLCVLLGFLCPPAWLLAVSVGVVQVMSSAM
jgi:hypothetical protein